jgi:hypothetical protein
VDIHPPNQSIHTWKDFFLHLLVVTIGLFIALTLEAAVESLHHRHLVRDARENLRLEIQENHTLHADNVRDLQKNLDQLERNIEELRDLRDGKKPEHSTLGWHWDWNTYNDAAWKAAQASGAVSFMDSKWISAYSSIYFQQNYNNSTALTLVTEETKIAAPLWVVHDPSKLTPAEIESMLIRSAEIDLGIRTLQTTMKGLDEMYAQYLKGATSAAGQNGR